MNYRAFSSDGLERLPYKQKVVGSNPTRPSIKRLIMIPIRRTDDIIDDIIIEIDNFLDKKTNLQLYCEDLVPGILDTVASLAYSIRIAFYEKN